MNNQLPSEHQAVVPKMGARRWGAWRCAGYAMVSLIGFIALNMAGCGGGGGGGNNAFKAPTSTVIAQLRSISDQVINGTVTLGGRTLTTSGGRAIFTGVRQGSQSITFTGDGLSSTGTIVVGREANQTFTLTPGLPVGQAVTITGRVLVNPGNPLTVNCGASSFGVTAPILIRVRDLNDPAEPVVASFIKPQQSANAAAGTFKIGSLPGPGTYRVEVTQAPSTSATDTTAPFAGRSASFTVNASQTVVRDLVICANAGNNPPGGTPPPPPVTPTPNLTATAAATVTPGAGTPGAGTPGAGTPGAGTPGAGTPAAPGGGGVPPPF